LNKFQRIAIRELEKKGVSMDPIGDPARIIRVWEPRISKGEESENRKHRMAKPHDIPDSFTPSSKLREKILSLEVEKEEREKVSTDKIFRNKHGWRLKDILQETDDDKLNLLLEDINPSDLDYPSPSEADMAAMQKLIYWEFDDPTIIDILRTHRYRDKLERDDYVERTLKKAKKNQNKCISDYQNPRTWNPVEGSISSSSDQSKLDRLIELGLNNTKELFLDERDKACAVIEGGGHLETRQIDSKFFKQYLGKLLFENEGKGVGSDTLNSAVNTLCAHARFAHDREHRRLHNRVAWHEGAIYYDLSSPQWDAVKITKDGWEIDEEPPPIFRRLDVHEEQAKPESGGDLDDIFKFANIQDEEDRLLFKVDIISQFIPGIPHPITILRGPHGSLKSATQWAATKLIDPSKLEDEEMGLPTKREQAHLHLYWFYALRYGNVSSIPKWLSDSLCRASTGGGHVKRTLYTDEEPQIYSYKRGVWLNGIGLSPSGADFRDRTLSFDLSIPENFKQLKTVRSDFYGERPRFLGAIFDAVSSAMDIKPKIEEELEELNLPRMKDFAVWGEAIARAMGCEENRFINAYLEKRGEQRFDVLEQNPVGRAILLLMEETEEWKGKSKELLEKLESIADEHGIDTEQKKWPGSPGWLTRRIREIKTELEEEGVNFSTGHDGVERWICLSSASHINGTNGTNGNSDTKGEKDLDSFINK